MEQIMIYISNIFYSIKTSFFKLFSARFWKDFFGALQIDISNMDNNLTISSLRLMIRKNKFQFVGTTILISLLLFLLNILLLTSIGIDRFGNTVREKLGIYFYIKDSPNQKDNIYGDVISMQQELKTANLEYKFYSKQDAFDTLSKKVPDLIKSFEKYKISNPLPATMYIMFQTLDEYESLVDIVDKYKGIIVNYDDVQKGKNSYDSQKERILNIINMTNFIRYLGYFLVLFLVVLTVVVVLFVLRLKFLSFYRNIEVNKLVGASYWQIKMPFIINAILMGLIGYIASMCIIYISVYILNDYTVKLFDVYLADIFDHDFAWSRIVLGEFVSMMIIIGLSSNIFVHRLIKKI